MAASETSFIDLPSELRNQIYEYYLAEIDETTIAISCGRFLPPALARASQQVREEFMSYWDTQHHDLTRTSHAKGIVIDLDFGPLMTFFDRAAPMLGRTVLFESVSITLVFSEHWYVPESRCTLQDWLDWSEEDGPPICAEGAEYKVDCDCECRGREHASLPLTTSRTSMGQLKRMRDAVQKTAIACPFSSQAVHGRRAASKRTRSR